MKCKCKYQPDNINLVNIRDEHVKENQIDKFKEAQNSQLMRAFKI